MSLGVDSGKQFMAELRAMAHPLRLRILSLLTGAAMTAADVARELDLNHANASYHLRQLLAVGQIEVAGEERIRGGVAKRYRYNLSRDVARYQGPPPDGLEAQRVALYAALAEELKRRARLFRWAPGRQHFTDAELWVTPETWTEVKALVDDASERLHRAARPPRTPGTIRGSAAFAMFEMEPDA
jgi:DNA-binding transcriptional ArsR family regulator